MTRPPDKLTPSAGGLTPPPRFGYTFSTIGHDGEE